jgi:Na+-transporting NADH:ubiquinone oxidoreductase subunit NqrB
LGALLFATALVVAGRASAGRSTATAVWRVLLAGLACGVCFIALVI